MTVRRMFLAGLGATALSPALAIANTNKRLDASTGTGYFPNPILHTHEGKKVRFYDDLIKDKIVVINMMYTVCAGICPANTATLRSVQEALGKRVGRDIFIYSLTLQPEIDTPRALHDYVKKYDIQPGWRFLTGKRADMESIRRKLGFYNIDPEIDEKLSNHTGMLRIGNAALDRWFMVPLRSSSRQIVHAIRDA